MVQHAVNAKGRIEVADVLRGLAVMGIILLHSIEHFNFYSFPDTSGQSPWLNFTDKAIWDGLFFLLGGKAYAVFALLFGFSFYIQDRNQRLRGNDFRLRFCWRLVLLFLIGNLNAMFFTAEVLVLYSLAGFILPLTCRLKDKTLLWLAAILLIQPVPLYYLLRALADPAFVTPVIPTGSFWAATFEAQSHGTFMETLRVNLWEGQLASLAWAWDNGRVFQTMALFLLGFYVGRRGWFEDTHLSVWTSVFVRAIVVFFPLYGLGNMLPDFIANKSVLTPLLLIITSLYKFAFMLMLVSGVLFAFYRFGWRKRLMTIAPYGRMSLTNYITQSIIGSMLFYNWGFGLHDNLGITASVIVGALLFVLQWTFCYWWMKSHAHGPLEYIWKKATWIGQKK